AERLMIVRYDRVATFLLKRSPFTAAEIARLRADAANLGFEVLYAPGAGPSGRGEWIDGTEAGEHAKLILAPDRRAFYEAYDHDIRPTTDDRPFFFHTTKLQNQFQVAFGRAMLFGNGLSALMTLLGISVALVALFVVGPLVIADRGVSHPPGWLAWLMYFGALGAGFMLIEGSIRERFVVLVGQPVYSRTVTLFSLLLGTGLGAAWSRRFGDGTLRRSAARGLVVVAAIAPLSVVVTEPLVTWAIPFSRSVRMAIAVATLVPI